VVLLLPSTLLDDDMGGIAGLKMVAERGFSKNGVDLGWTRAGCWILVL